MAKKDTRRVLVIKDIPSNFIEEAILILKSDPNERKNAEKATPLNKNKKGSDYLLKEAEAIINSYIRENRFKGIAGTPAEPVLAVKKQDTITNTAINVILVGSILALIIVFTQLF